VPESARGGSRRLAWVGAAAVAAGATVFAVRAETGCTTHQCDPDTVAVGTPLVCTPDGGSPGACEGGLGFGTAFRNGSEIVWESAGYDEGWLDFRGLRTFNLDWSQAVSCQLGIDPCTLNNYDVIDWEADISINDAGKNKNLVSGAGQLANIVCLSSSRMCVTNGSCAPYFLRVVVHLLPAADAGMPDGADAAQDAPLAD
jgi:hypothetical protein